MYDSFYSGLCVRVSDTGFSGSSVSDGVRILGGDHVAGIKFFLERGTVYGAVHAAL